MILRQNARAALCVVLLLAVADVSRGDFRSLAARVPGSANVLILLDVERILASPMAAREGWQERYDAAYAAGLLDLPPTARRYLGAAEIDLSSTEAVWQMGLVESSQRASLAAIARRSGGELDEVADTQAVALGDNGFIVQVSPDTLAGVASGNRQHVARWLRNAASHSLGALPASIASAIEQADQGRAEIVVLFDFADAVSAPIARRAVESSAVMAGRADEVAAMTQLLEGIKGAALFVNVGETLTGQVFISFADDVGPLGSACKPLLLELLDKHGARIDDLENWPATVDGKRITMQGPLSDDGLRRLLSLVDPPTPSAGASGQSDESNAASASQQYFRAVQSLIDDLRASSKDAVTIAQVGVWFGKYAQKVDRLPQVDVDPELLDYGVFVSDQLRAAGGEVRGIGIRTGANQARYGDRSGYGYGSRTAAQRTQTARIDTRAKERAQGATSAIGIVQSIDGETAKIRRAMSQRYKVEF